MITFHTWGIYGYLEEKLHTFSTSHSESRPNKLFKLNSRHSYTTQKSQLPYNYLSEHKMESRVCESSRFTQLYV